MDSKSRDIGSSPQEPEGGAERDPSFSGGHPARPELNTEGWALPNGHGVDDPNPAAGSAPTATGRHRRRLILVLIITLGVVVVQLVGALVSGSLALLADTGHLLTDATGIAIALTASYVATRPATPKRTFGYLRVEVLAALANGVILGAIAVIIVVEAIRRFGSEVEIATGPMLIAAGVGLIANLVSLLVLRSAQRESLNVRGAYLEVLGDLLGSIAVIAAGLIIMGTGANWVDQVASILIAALIAPRAYSLLREVVNVLLEAAPRGFDVEAVRAHLLTVPGVLEVHDVHAWLLTSGVPAFSAHVTVSDPVLEQNYHATLDKLKACLRTHFDVDHTTLQLEPEGHRQPGPHRHN